MTPFGEKEREMSGVEWISGEIKPANPGLYVRRSKSSVEDAYWDGEYWRLAKKGAELRIYERPHLDQNRPWHPPRVRRVDSLEGKKFGRLSFVRDVGYEAESHRWLAVFKCECGNEKAMNVYEVVRGRLKGCGCQMHSAEARAINGAKKKAWGEENREELLRIRKQVGQKRIGHKNPLGPSAQWSLNVRAKHWHIRNDETGAELRGWNLSQMIRENERFFLQDDVVWVGSSCRAVKRISQLVNGKVRGRPIKSWRGWRIVRESEPA